MKAGQHIISLSLGDAANPGAVVVVDPRQTRKEPGLASREGILPIGLHSHALRALHQADLHVEPGLLERSQRAR